MFENSTTGIIMALAALLTASAGIYRLVAMGMKGDWLKKSIPLILIAITYVLASLALLTRDNNVRKHADVTWASAIHAIDVPVLIYNDEMRIIDANHAAADFYSVEKEQLLGRRPADLHILIRRVITNFDAWSAEQTDRVVQGEKGTLDSKTKVPMRLSSNHPLGPAEWYITSHPITVKGDRFYVTRFSRIGGEP